MRSYLRHPLTLLWLVLLLATVVSWWLGSDDHPAAQSSALTAVAILAVAIVKCRLVIRNYMEVGHAPLWLRLTCDTWLLLNFGMVSSFYWFAI